MVKLRIALLAGKGGITKSTLARALAVRLTQRGFSTVGVDMDQGQASFWSWSQRRLDNAKCPITFPVVNIALPMRVKRELANADFEAGVIDAGAYASADTVEISGFVDLVCIPTTTSVDDLESAIRLVKGLLEKDVPAERIAIVFSGLMDTEEEVREARDYFDAMGVYSVPGGIERMKSYRKAQDKGASIIETAFPGPNYAARLVIDAIIDRAIEVKETA